MHCITKTLLTSVLSAGLFSSGFAQEKAPIKIGEINSYKAAPASNEPYRKGWELAVEEINAKGGVMGRKLQTIFRDDNANPGDGVRMAEELLTREKVDVLAGVLYSHVGLAVADFANQRKTFFLATSPMTDKIVWQNGNRYTYRLRGGTYSAVAAVIPAAVALKKKRWAIVYPNFEYGQAAISAFKEALKAAQPDVEFVVEQAPPFGKLDAGPVVQAIEAAKPDAIFNALFGVDLAKFSREGKTRDLFAKRDVVSLLTGDPEYLDPLRDDAPDNWISTGYPYASSDTPEHNAFFVAYMKKYKDYPRLSSVFGYSAVKALAAGIEKAQSTDSEKMIAAFRGLKFDTPFGKVEFRTQDNQSTMGVFVGRIGRRDGKGYLTDASYIDGSKLQPKDEVVRQLRPAN